MRNSAGSFPGWTGLGWGIKGYMFVQSGLNVCGIEGNAFIHHVAKWCFISQSVIFGNVPQYNNAMLYWLSIGHFFIFVLSSCFGFK